MKAFLEGNLETKSAGGLNCTYTCKNHHGLMTCMLRHVTKITLKRMIFTRFVLTKQKALLLRTDIVWEQNK